MWLFSQNSKVEIKALFFLIIRHIFEFLPTRFNCLKLLICCETLDLFSLPFWFVHLFPVFVHIRAPTCYPFWHIGHTKSLDRFLCICKWLVRLGLYANFFFGRMGIYICLCVIIYIVKVHHVSSLFYHKFYIYFEGQMIH